MKLNGRTDVKALATDVKNYSFQEAISFCLCDVDLYIGQRPTRSGMSGRSSAQVASLSLTIARKAISGMARMRRTESSLASRG